MLQQKTRQEIMESLGHGGHDQMKVNFFNHKMPDMGNDSIIEARYKADLQAEEKSKIVGSAQIPDYSIPNLIRLGAKQSYKKELYIKIVRRGAKDWRSMKATQEHKNKYEKEYNKFLEDNQNDKTSDDKRQTIQPNPSGFNYDSQTIGSASTFGEFSYSFNI